MPTSFRPRAVLIILLAVLVRFAFAAAVDLGKLKTEHNPDAEDYLSFAHNLATGVGFAHAANEDQPFSQPVEFSAWRAPLYPMLLAVAFHVSRATLFLQSIQIALAALSLYFLMRVALILFGELPAFLAGLAFALYPLLIFYSADLGTESLFLFLLMAVLFLFYQAAAELSLGRVCSLGVLVGLAALCRPNGLMLAPALALAIWLNNRNRWRVLQQLVVIGLTVAIVVLPWTYRNYRLFHKFVLISTNGGATLWAGAHLRLEPGASLAEVGYSQHRAFRDVSEPDREHYYYRQAFAILDHSPSRWGALFLDNFAAMYTLIPSATYHSRSSRIFYFLSYAPLLVAGIAGWYRLRKRWRQLSLLWGWVLVNTAFYCLYLTSIRYRIPTIDPILMLGAGVSVAALIQRLKPNKMPSAST